MGMYDPAFQDTHSYLYQHEKVSYDSIMGWCWKTVVITPSKTENPKISGIVCIEDL